MADRTPSKLRRRIALALVPILLVVLGILLLPRSASGLMDFEVNQAHRSGLPTTYAERDKLLPTDGDNAAPVYLEVVKHLSSGAEARAYRDLDEIARDQVQTNTVRARDDLRVLQDALALCRKGAAMPRCSFAGMFRNGKMDRKAYIDAERVPILLYECSLVESGSGDEATALKDAGAILGVGQQMARDPGFMAFMNSSWFYDIAFRTWAGCLNSHSSDRTTVLAALKLAEMDPAVPNPRLMLAGDFPDYLVEYRSAINHPKQYEGTREKENGWLKRRSYRMPFLESEFWTSYSAAQVVRQWRDTYQGLPADPKDWEGAQKVFLSANDKTSKIVPAKYLFDSPFDTYPRLCDDVGREVAIERLARTSAKLLLYRLDHGDLPESLPESGSDGTDPFTGKPLKYRKAGKGFVIYSVGTDRKDQGGVSSEAGLRESPDIVMAFD